MMLTDPLAPAMQVERAYGLVAWGMRITYEPQMGLIALSRQCLGETGDTAGNAASPRIRIRALKSEYMKLHRSISST
jgi:hypothetical protein